MEFFFGVEDPDPQDPHVFGPPGSGFTCQRYGSGFKTEDDVPAGKL